MSTPVPIGTRIGVVYYVLWALLAALFTLLSFSWLKGTPTALGVAETDLVRLIMVAGLFALGLAFTAALSWRYLPGRGSIDVVARELRSGRRVVRFDEITRAYRIPGGPQAGEFGVRFRIERGRDLRLQISSRSFTDATAAQVDALIALVTQAPITLDTHFTPRPPVRDELGARSIQQQVDDTTGELIMLYEETSYSREVLLEELTVAREVLNNPDGTFPWALGPNGNAKIGAILAGNAPRGALETRALPPAKLIAVQGPVTAPYSRGFFGTLSKKYRSERTAVETWLLSVNPIAVIPTFGRINRLGWALIALMLFPPVIIDAALSGAFIWIPGMTLLSTMTVFAFVGTVFLLSPIIIWMGFVVTWYARVRRHQALRKAVLAERGRGVVPENIRAFFGSPHPDGYIEGTFVLIWGTVWVLAIGGGITAVGAGVATWDTFGPAQSLTVIIIGAAFAVASFPWFGVGVKRIARRSVMSTVGELEAQLMGEWETVATPKLDAQRMGE